jgi:hypothetical protein
LFSWLFETFNPFPPPPFTPPLNDENNNRNSSRQQKRKKNKKREAIIYHCSISLSLSCLDRISILKYSSVKQKGTHSHTYTLTNNKVNLLSFLVTCFWPFGVLVCVCFGCNSHARLLSLHCLLSSLIRCLLFPFLFLDCFGPLIHVVLCYFAF